MKSTSAIAKTLLCIYLTLSSVPSFSQERPVLLFSYFKGNGEDGLHLAHSEDGLSWKALNNDSSMLKPLVGKEKLMRDPCIITGKDGLFHMVWTASWQDKGIGYASSKDLLHWSEQRLIPVMEFEQEAMNCWAPEITYDRDKSTYIIYWATTIPGRFPTTDSSGDGKYNHRIYFTTTKDFKTFSKAAVLYDKGFSVIDATIVRDDSRYVMFLKDETRNPPQKNIRVATATGAVGPFSAPSKPITGSYWAEGPSVARLQDAWIVYFDKYTEHSMGAVRSNDLKTWTDISSSISFPSGTRHGSVFTVTPARWQQLRNALSFR